MSKDIRVLSLFDGISCGMVALERAGFNVIKYDAYEIDKNAIKVSQYNYPNIMEKGNVFEAQYEENDYDLLIGGSPCTSFSVARGGNQRETKPTGLGYELFMQYIRALRTVKPRWYLYENNASMSDSIKEAISKEFGHDPIMVDSADFSAQERKRYYWTNIPIKEWTPKNLYIKDIIYDDTYKVKNFDKYADTIKISKDGNRVKWDTSGNGNYSQQNRARSKNIRMNTVAACGVDKCNIWLGNTTYRLLHPVEAERLQTLPDNYTAVLADGQRIKCVGNGWTVDVIAHILSGITSVI